MKKIYLNIFIYLFVTLIIVLIAEFFSRKFEKNPYYKLKPLAYANFKEEISSHKWKLDGINSCTSESFDTFNKHREPLIPSTHLSNKENKILAYYTDDLGLTLSGRGPRKFQKKNILILGGSTIHGDGLECDEYTLPSALNRQIKSSISFHNHGTSAYSSSESTNYFLNFIKFFSPPEEFWFIEGINDVMRKVILGIPSYTYGFSALGMSSKLSLRFFIIESLASRSALFRTVFQISPKINGNIIESEKLYPISIKNFNEISKKELISYRAKVAAEMTVKNYKFIKEISNFKGIKVRFFTQPNIFDKIELSPIEKKILEKVNNYYPVELLKQAFDEYYQNLIFLSSKNKIEIHDLRNCINQTKKLIYFDINHLSPQGNNILAECIIKKNDMLKLFDF